MKRINYVQTGGLRFNSERVQVLQTAADIFSSLGYIAGNKTIIQGCAINGFSTGDGFVFYNGELYEFKGGITQARVKIIEQPLTKMFQNGTVKAIEVDRHITFGSGAGSILWSEFKRITPLADLQGRILPPGTNPQMYTGALIDIPQGWFLCNGQNGTPDLRQKFIVGYDPDNADYNAIGKTGGSKEVQLSEPHLPKHYHSGQTNESGSHKHVGFALKGSNSDNGDSGGYVITSGTEANGNQANAGETTYAGEHTHYFNTDETGSDLPHENRPPYYTLAFIIYKG